MKWWWWRRRSSSSSTCERKRRERKGERGGLKPAPLILLSPSLFFSLLSSPLKEERGIGEGDR